MSLLTDPQTYIAFATLVALELVLGVDNIIFISLLAGKLPEHERAKARTAGLSVAILSRIALLFSLSFIVHLTDPLFTILGFAVSGRDMILLGGGLFLLAKATFEIHDKLEGESSHHGGRSAPSFAGVVAQIMVLDIVFSLDSVITAVGMVDQLPIMVAAVIVAALAMMFTAQSVSDFVDRHPTVKMLALSFLLLVGFTLVAEGLHQHIAKGYIYFAMGFSVFVEMLNIRMRKKADPPVALHGAPSVKVGEG